MYRALKTFPMESCLSSPFEAFLVVPEASTGAIGVCPMIGASSGGRGTTKFCLK
jgi:hypothetical protein